MLSNLLNKYNSDHVTAQLNRSFSYHLYNWYTLLSQKMNVENPLVSIIVYAFIELVHL